MKKEIKTEEVIEEEITMNQVLEGRSIQVLPVEAITETWVATEEVATATIILTQEMIIRDGIMKIRGGIMKNKIMRIMIKTKKRVISGATKDLAPQPKMKTKIIGMEKRKRK